jgi:uncharacterized membrane protein YphA (DoxX/SURF4 family)
MKSFRLIVLFCAVGMAFICITPRPVSAHEQYVLTPGQFNADYANTNVHVLDALKNPVNVAIAVKVSVAVFIVFALYFFFVSSRFEQVLDAWLSRFEPAVQVLVRIAVGISLIYSAATSVFLGPEIPLLSLPLGTFIRIILYIAGVLLVLGLFSEIAGFLSLLVIIAATWVYKDYMLTYFNYFGEFAALFFLGSRIFSLDKLIFGAKKFAEKFKNWEIALLRVTYGISVLYPAITIKLFHPEVIVDIVNRYHLNDIHWLFPQDPLLISLGTGLAQIVVGLFIIIGFETRLASFSTFILYVLSILFFKETVWPHYILLTLALYLTINDGGTLTLDNLIERLSIKRRFRIKKAA